MNDALISLGLSKFPLSLIHNQAYQARRLPEAKEPYRDSFNEREGGDI